MVCPSARPPSAHRCISFALAIPLLVAACGGQVERTDPAASLQFDAAAPYPSTADCDRLVADTKAERARVRQCREASECGQVIHGESCGCTHDPVARLDADLTLYEALRKRAGELGCSGLGGGSTCDCATADGFACVNNVCSWNDRR